MWCYTFWVFSVFCLIVTYGQTPAPKVCWDTTWYNNSAPTATNRSEYESKSKSVLDSICPKGKVIAAQCRDTKGEPFQTFKNDTISKYIATCTVVTGLICHPYNNSKSICPDFEIQYGCACLTNSSTEGSGIGASGNQHGPSCNGAQIYETSLFMLIICSVLKIFG